MFRLYGWQTAYQIVWTHVHAHVYITNAFYKISFQEIFFCLFFTCVCNYECVLMWSKYAHNKYYVNYLTYYWTTLRYIFYLQLQIRKNKFAGFIFLIFILLLIFIEKDQNSWQLEATLSVPDDWNLIMALPMWWGWALNILTAIIWRWIILYSGYSLEAC